MLEKIAQEFRGAFAPRACRMRTTNAGSGQGAFDRVNAVVVQLVVLLRRSLPIADIRFVPNLPVPGLDCGPSVLLDAMSNPLVEQFGPLLIIFRWIGPTRKDRTVRLLRRPAMPV